RVARKMPPRVTFGANRCTNVSRSPYRRRTRTGAEEVTIGKRVLLSPRAKSNRQVEQTTGVLRGGLVDHRHRLTAHGGQRLQRLHDERRFVALAAEGDGGQERGVGLDQDAIQRSEGGRLAEGGGVLESQDSRK